MKNEISYFKCFRSDGGVFTLFQALGKRKIYLLKGDNLIKTNVGKCDFGWREKLVKNILKRFDSIDKIEYYDYRHETYNEVYDFTKEKQNGNTETQNKECNHEWEEIGFGVFSHIYKCKKCGKHTTTFM